MRRTVLTMLLLLGACVDVDDDDDDDEPCSVDAVDGVAVDPATCRPTPLSRDDCRADGDCPSGAVCFGVEAACQDDDDSTVCQRIGRCFDPNRANYCRDDDDCFDGSCRTDDRFCLQDRRNVDSDECMGWCVYRCASLGESYSVDPDTGTCWNFGDNCHPPAFVKVTDRDACPNGGQP